MTRPRSEKIHELKARLIDLIQHGFYRPGGRFFSNRDLAQRFHVSYQTAHRLITELVGEGWLERRPASGTYISGDREKLSGVQLVFNERGKRPDSFGQRLLNLLTSSLDADGIAWRVSWIKTEVQLARDLYPVIWETPGAIAQLDSRYALLLNDEPPPGILASYLDSVSTDDFSGGACAAQLLAQSLRKGGRKRVRAVVLAGPKSDRRSLLRVAGFQSVMPGTRVCWSDSWYYEDGYAASLKVMRIKPAAVFACNDRLAEGLIHFYQEKNVKVPALVGFDDAPVAEKLYFSTVAIPWLEMTAGAMTVIRKRLRGETGTASRQVFAPRPVVRKR